MSSEVSHLRFLFLSIVLFGLPLAGCGSEGDVATVPASATVTLDGEPIDGVTVTLVPEGSGVKGKGGYGVTDASGNVTFKSGPEADGVAPGKYRVLFQKLTQADGSPIPPDAMAIDLETVNAVPEIYNDPGNSPILATIEAEGSADPLTFELKSR